MKVIDLINKKANGEELPEKIMVHGIYFKYNGELTYTNKDFFSKETYLFSDDYDWGRWINDEVEILEEEKKTKPLEEEKKIPEKIEEPRFNKGRYYIKDINGDDSEISGIERTFRLKTNEIIDYLKSKGE